MSLKTKICSKCKKEKDLSEFIKCKGYKDGHINWCRNCTNINSKKWYKNNKIKALKTRKKYKQNNKEKIKKDQRKYHQKNKEKFNKLRNQRFKTDINFKVVYNLRTRLHHAIKGRTKSKRTLNLLGCSIKELKKHLESQFIEDMSWDNYGLWHIDHKKPCSKYDLSKKSEQCKCFNYTNLQPLWAEDNWSKGNRLEIINKENL